MEKIFSDDGTNITEMVKERELEISNEIEKLFIFVGIEKDNKEAKTDIAKVLIKYA